jgi:hypothetical protein
MLNAARGRQNEGNEGGGGGPKAHLRINPGLGNIVATPPSFSNTLLNCSACAAAS